ncbi:hypothetical protein [Marivita sp. XM-24bin2]|jgi:hypothetical protein|uniref:hypothetical protein n=1 Tax=unclassified Marivita TaxID=2632480 RepID=UPI000D7A91C6|nr:hypothetical protein [Marivita sp. XM-24bin2]MCR9108891.1 hypothetical protein [Paracoccaceae bacterium]PWL34947.1 MAG: hypothetical protein DCO97_11935 [Marivita sp. XM-24bin2]
MTALAGARNMLVNCAKAQAGERVLIAYEPAEYGYFDAHVLNAVVRCACDLGLLVKAVNVGFTPCARQFSDALRAEIDKVDIVVFLARLGDQLRFSDVPKDKRIVVCFALDEGLLGSGFGTTSYGAFVALKELITDALSQSANIRLTCPNGTDVKGVAEMPPSSVGDTSILRFPMSVFKPVPAQSFSGRVALCGFLTGTGSQYYEGYTVEFDGPVMAHLQQGRLVGFTGMPQDVSAANAHYDRISETLGIDRNCVHSWHAGIHPGCGYLQEARENYERWSGAAFGNPRILHFHTCGSYAPGEISWNVLDPTIWIDGVPVWENGVFHPVRLAEGQAVLDRYPDAAAIFAHPDAHVGLTQFGAMTERHTQLEAVS